MDLETLLPGEGSLRAGDVAQQPARVARICRPGLRASRSISAPCSTRRRASRASAIFSIAHLSDAERMFFVSLLLNQVLGWMRAQSGTTSLRAILYMDEIFGYFPPVANPPSKKPLLTLLKQARAFGLGVVLATQNPVDLDYKGLSNAGTWFIGRLQTERDKMRVLDGLEGATPRRAPNSIGSEMKKILSGLGNRVFLMNNVHEDAPVVFQTRWTLSYLRGPLTRDQIRLLAGSSTARSAAVSSASPAASGCYCCARIVRCRRSARPSAGNSAVLCSGTPDRNRDLSACCSWSRADSFLRRQAENQREPRPAVCHAAERRGNSLRLGTGAGARHCTRGS